MKSLPVPIASMAATPAAWSRPAAPWKTSTLTGRRLGLRRRRAGEHASASASSAPAASARHRASRRRWTASAGCRRTSSLPCRDRDVRAVSSGALSGRPRRGLATAPAAPLMRSVKAAVIRPLRPGERPAGRRGPGRSAAAARPPCAPQRPRAASTRLPQPEPARPSPGVTSSRTAPRSTAWHAHADRQPAAPQRRDRGPPVARDAARATRTARRPAPAGSASGRRRATAKRDPAVELDVPDEIARPEVDPVPAEPASRSNAPAYGVQAPRRRPGTPSTTAPQPSPSARVKRDARPAGVRATRRAAVDAAPP